MKRNLIKLLCIFLCFQVFAELDQQRKNGNYYISGNILFPKRADFISDYQLYLLNERGDTIKKTSMIGGNKRFFLIDSVKLSSRYSLFIRKMGKQKAEDVIYLLNSNDKKMAKFTVTDAGYYCKIDTSLKKHLFSKHTAPLTTASSLIDIEAKLLYGPNKNKPLKKHKVYLTNSKGDTLKNTITDNYGDFAFKQIQGKQDLNIKVENTPIIKNEKEIYVAQQNGVIVSTIKREGNSFTYRMLEPDVVKLKPMNVDDDDTDFKIDAFSKSSEKTIIVAQNIYYPINEYKITDDAADQLDVIVDQLKKNPSYKLEITSHTDSQGDDAFNLDLSKKRANAVMEYLVTWGIARNRLTAIGMGETKLMNRCGNGEICTEKEHELNRRTEFKFIK